jgi:hypothetical protein
MRDRISRLSTKQRTDTAEKTRTNREKCPELTAWIDDFKAVFGPGVKVKWVRWPDGTEQGRRGNPGVPVSIPHTEGGKK